MAPRARGATVKADQLRCRLLQARLVAGRWRYVHWLLAVILTVSTGLQWIAAPWLHQQTLLAQAQAGEKMSQRPSLDPSEARHRLLSQRVKAFEQVLGDNGHAEEQARAIFAMARDAQLTLTQSSYALQPGGNALFDIYEVDFPVQGSYAKVRSLCEEVLAEIPFASLDSISVKRSQATGVVEAQLHWSFFLRPRTSGPSSDVRVVAEQPS